MQWSFVAISEADLDDIIEIETCSFKRPWSRLSFLNELACKDAYAFGARIKRPAGNDTLAGYIFFRLIFDEMHLMRISVAVKWRGLGIATGLFEKSIELAISKGATRVFLEVRPSNRPAIGFYRKIGLEVIGRRKRYYPETGEDALVMGNNLAKK